MAQAYAIRRAASPDDLIQLSRIRPDPIQLDLASNQRNPRKDAVPRNIPNQDASRLNLGQVAPGSLLNRSPCRPNNSGRTDIRTEKNHCPPVAEMLKTIQIPKAPRPTLKIAQTCPGISLAAAALPLFTWIPSLLRPMERRCRREAPYG